MYKTYLNLLCNIGRAQEVRIKRTIQFLPSCCMYTIVVMIVTRLRAGRSMLPISERPNFFFSENVQADCRAETASYSVDTGGSFPVLKRPGLDIPPSFEIENEWSCVSTTSLYFNDVDRDDSSFCVNRSGHNMIIIFIYLFIYLFIEYLRSSSTTCTQDHKSHTLHQLLAAASDLLP
jgi:hypothetical protein